MLQVVPRGGSSAYSSFESDLFLVNYMNYVSNFTSSCTPGTAAEIHPLRIWFRWPSCSCPASHTAVGILVVARSVLVINNEQHFHIEYNSQIANFKIQIFVLFYICFYSVALRQTKLFLFTDGYCQGIDIPLTRFLRGIMQHIEF